MVKGPEFTFLFIILIAMLVASLLAVNEFIKVGKAKGYYMDNAGLLWFIGIFMPLGPLAVGLYVVALPDRSQRPAAPAASAPTAPAVLPSIDGTAPAAPQQPAPAQPAAPAPTAPAPAAPQTPNDLPSL